MQVFEEKKVKKSPSVCQGYQITNEKLYNQLIYYKLLMQYRSIMLESKSINKTIICLVAYARFLGIVVPKLGIMC